MITVHEADNDDPRHLMLVHPQLHIGALLTYRPNDPPQTVHLKPLAIVSGQLPAGFADADVSFMKPPAERDPKFARLPPDPPYLISVVRADLSGRFELKLPAGVAYQVESYAAGNGHTARETTRKLSPGEKYSVGILDLAPYRTAGGVL